MTMSFNQIVTRVINVVFGLSLVYGAYSAYHIHDLKTLQFHALAGFVIAGIWFMLFLMERSVTDTRLKIAHIEGMEQALDQINTIIDDHKTTPKNTPGQKS